MDCFLVYFDPFVFCSLIDYFFPLPGLFLYVGSCITIIPAILSTDAILSIALHTILAILHRVLHRYFGSNHVLLVLCASVPLGFLFFFSTFNRSFACLSQRKNKVSLIPNLHHTLKRKRARRHKNTNKMQRLKKRRCPKLTRKYDVARPNMALSSSSKKDLRIIPSSASLFLYRSIPNIPINRLWLLLSQRKMVSIRATIRIIT